MRSGVVRSSGPRLLAIVLLGAIVAACGIVGRSGPPGGSTSSPTRPGLTADATGAAPPPGTPAATVASSAEPASTGSAGPSSATSEPPSVTLAADGGDLAIGQLGSYTWLDGGSDSPWLPGTPLTVGAGEPLAVTIVGGLAVADWYARRATAATTDGSGAIALGQAGGPPMAFAAPASGAWSVQVTVRFANDLGSATYYWRLTVR